MPRTDCLTCPRLDKIISTQRRPRERKHQPNSSHVFLLFTEVYSVAVAPSRARALAFSMPAIGIDGGDGESSSQPQASLSWARLDSNGVVSVCCLRFETSSRDKCYSRRMSRPPEPSIGFQENSVELLLFFPVREAIACQCQGYTRVSGVHFRQLRHSDFEYGRGSTYTYAGAVRSFAYATMQSAQPRSANDNENSQLHTSAIPQMMRTVCFSSSSIARNAVPSLATLGLWAINNIRDR